MQFTSHKQIMAFGLRLLKSEIDMILDEMETIPAPIPAGKKKGAEPSPPSKPLHWMQDPKNRKKVEAQMRRMRAKLPKVKLERKEALHAKTSTVKRTVHAA